MLNRQFKKTLRGFLIMNHSEQFTALCADARTRVKETTVAAVMAKLQAKQPFLLIDVREADEYAAGALPQAVHLSKVG